MDLQLLFLEIQSIHLSMKDFYEFCIKKPVELCLIQYSLSSFPLLLVCFLNSSY